MNSLVTILLKNKVLLKKAIYLLWMGNCYQVLSLQPLFKEIWLNPIMKGKLIQVFKNNIVSLCLINFFFYYFKLEFSQMEQSQTIIKSNITFLN
jgi:hypothetical protein